MIRLKKENEVFTYGQYDLLLEDDQQIYAYTRTSDDDKVVVITNLSTEEASFEADDKLSYEQLLLNNYPVEKHGDMDSFTLKPYEARV
ncbi:glycosyl hydrolase, partial [Shouchella clausii]